MPKMVEIPDPPYTITIYVDADNRVTTQIEPAIPPPPDATGELSDNFTWHEATYSSTAEQLGINNEPNHDETEAIEGTAEFMEQVRVILGSNPISVSSWFRNEATNNAVGGSSTSEHRYGRAVDFSCNSCGSVYQCCQKIAADKDLPFNQLIYENHGSSKWVHLSRAADGATPKREVLTINLNGTHHGLVA